jgi:hypothetical protein
MSSYQEVSIVKVQGATIVLDVREVHVDMPAFHDLVGRTGKVPARRRRDAAIFASFLLRDYGTPLARNAFCNALRARTTWPPPTELVADLTLTQLEPVATSASGPPLYRARVTITVAEPSLLAGFNPWEREHFLG